MRKFLPLVALGTLVLSGCTSVNEVAFDQDGGCSGVVVAVNYSGFGNDVLSCVSMPGQTALAKDLFAAVGVSTEGTKAYGDQVVCRVNDIPGKNQTISISGEPDYVEECNEMPSALAYWGFFSKSQGQGSWAFATDSIANFEVEAGDSIGLAFSVAGNSARPTD